MESLNVTEIKKGDLIFSEGSSDPVLYEVEYGTIGIYKGYGTDKAVKLTEITDGYFGESGLAENGVRIASAVAETDCGVIRLDAESMKEYFTENPFKLDVLLQDLSRRLRSQDRRYIDACKYIDQLMEAEESGSTLDPEAIKSMKELISGK